MRGNRSGAIVATVKLRYRLLLAVEHTSCGSGLRAQAIEGFVQQLAVSYVANGWGIGTGLPVTYVVNREGKVVHLFNGVISGNSLRAVLTPLLRGKA